MNRLADTFVLSNGRGIPCIGLGTWQTASGEEAVEAVSCAIKMGYRHIDGAAIYGNERSVGKGVALGIREAGISREELFVTSKLWNTERGYDRTLDAFEKTLADLGLDYLDLYLIHWPAAAHQFDDWQAINRDTWRAFEKLYHEGRVRSIGVSNFLRHHLEPLMTADVAPMVDQLEFHPGFMQTDIVSYCQHNGVQVEGWSPLGRGKLLTDGRMVQIAERYGVSTAQLCVRWALQHDVLPLPKSTHEQRIRENADVFGFKITAQDMDAIDVLPFMGGSGSSPDEVDF